MHVEINSGNYLTAFLITFPKPFGTSIKIAYFNINAGQTANIYSMVTYSLTPTDEANGQRLRYQGVRYADQKVTRTATATTTLAQITGGPGAIVYHSYVAGIGASNLSWLERNFSITVDGEPPRRSSVPAPRTGSTAGGTSTAAATTTPASTATSAPTSRPAT